MKKLCWNCLKFILLFIIIISSSLAIYMHYKGSTFHPISEIQRLKAENRRDDALDLGSGRQGCNPAGESPAMSIARFRHVVIPRLMWVTTFSLRGVNGLAAL